ncbi:MAG: GMC family oxidoreductase N-terminal domain-containing protein [Geminicoccaceae bacterium]|nr:GMC family oxidoreductase N-terminal domain-containing protein [Geminicoccaceae bacterium]
MEESFDHVIVGAGSAGCVLAARLSEDPGRSVLLLEAGGSDEDVRVATPAKFGGLPNTRFDWAYRTAPQRELAHRQIAYPRGRGIGGTGSINYMIYLRGHPADYDGWRDSGCEGWGWSDVLPFFRLAEHHLAPGDPEIHGRDGPLTVALPARRYELAEMFLEACQQAGIAFNTDLNGDRLDGCGYFPGTVARGERGSTARTYLREAGGRPNLRIETGATVLRLVVGHGRVRAVEYLHRGQSKRVFCDGEIVLAAGAIGSPHLLMLSGIGPADELAALGIDPACDLPGVGRNLQDHLHYRSRWEITRPLSNFGRNARETERIEREYADDRSGPLASHLFESGAFLRSGTDVEVPDIELLMVPHLISPGATELRPPDRHGFTIPGFPTRPESRGRVALASADPLDRPIIDPGYLSDPRDADVTISLIRRAREVAGQKAFASILGQEISPGPSCDSDEAILNDIRAMASTSFHPVGTCRMGIDEEAVVDPRLRLRGLDGLRIADASIMPRMNTGHPNAPTIMIAERAAALMRES